MISVKDKNEVKKCQVICNSTGKEARMEGNRRPKEAGEHWKLEIPPKAHDDDLGIGWRTATSWAPEMQTQYHLCC